ncbi:MAG TPA: hypothetical protein VKV73_12320 [Chloroflexota bacterium]|nr:hypothetical protein [Chloroflexota bacterium]
MEHGTSNYTLRAEPPYGPAPVALQGLDGHQGVIIPATNVKHLMLKQDVVDAVAAGTFRVWAVRTVDEGLALLTGLPAGKRLADGQFPAGTIHGRVQERLANLAERLVEFRRHAQKETSAVSRDGHRQRLPQVHASRQLP